MDVEVHRAASLFEAYDLDYYTDDAAELISDPNIDLVYVASNHASHAPYAIQSLKAGKSVHIEKPHCVTESQLTALVETMQDTDGSVTLGFNRPDSCLGRLVRAALLREEGPMMLNWFVAGHRIDPDHWYFHEEEGGRILGNLCHWTDFVYRLIPEADRYPIIITPTRAHKTDADVAVTFRFGDGSIAAITFSAKGHTFEGVRERFSAHRGDVLASLDDFASLTLDIGARKTKHRLRHRDHGHERSIVRSYRMVREEGHGASPSYVWETGDLFLKTREALERDETICLEPYAPASREAARRTSTSAESPKGSASIHRDP